MQELTSKEARQGTLQCAYYKADKKSTHTHREQQSLYDEHEHSERILNL